MNLTIFELLTSHCNGLCLCRAACDIDMPDSDVYSALNCGFSVDRKQF